MNFNIATWMMLFFILFMIIGLWKIYAFLPNRELADDDMTRSSQEELMQLMLKVIKENEDTITPAELYEKMKSDADFDAKHFWRFNQNRVNQLLELYYLQNPHVSLLLHKHPREEGEM